MSGPHNPGSTFLTPLFAANRGWPIRGSMKTPQIFARALPLSPLIATMHDATVEILSSSPFFKLDKNGEGIESFRDVRDQVNICKYLIYIRNRSRVLCKSWNVTFLTSVCFFLNSRREGGEKLDEKWIMTNFWKFSVHVSATKRLRVNICKYEFPLIATIRY